MDQRRRNTLFGFKNIIILAFISISYTKLIDGAPTYDNKKNRSCEDIRQCVQSYKNVSGIATSRDALNYVCLNIDDAMSCTRDYAEQCMPQVTDEERNDIRDKINQETSNAKELCKPGPYQEEYLQHAPCMQRASYTSLICKINVIKKLGNDTMDDNVETDYIKRRCCVIQEYYKCAIDGVRQMCGEKTAQFGASFTERQSPRQWKSQCAAYDVDKCSQSNVTTTAQQQ